LREDLLFDEDNDSHIADVFFLRSLVGDALWVNGVTRVSEGAMQVIAGAVLKLEALVGFLVVLGAPSGKFIAISVPIEAPHAALRFLLLVRA